MSLVIEDIHSMRENYLPQSLQPYVNIRLWNDMVHTFREGLEEGSLYSCACEVCCCICLAFPCIFCFHPCIVKGVTKQRIEQKCELLNKVHFQGQPIIIPSEQGSFIASILK